MKADSSSHHTLAQRIGRYLLVGVLTIAPLWVTWLVFEFVLGLLTGLGAPAVAALVRVVEPLSPEAARWIAHPYFDSTLAVLLTIVALILVGMLASRVVGRRVIAGMEAILERIPLVQAVYGGTKRFITAMRHPPAKGQRVVLISFPNPHMKTVGFITSIMKDESSGRELAAVYVPTAPNPTSGYIEIVPMDEVVYIDWTVEQVMSFVVTGGANTPGRIRFAGSAPTDGDRR